MEQLMKEHEKLEKKQSLKKSIDEVQDIIDLLTEARNNVAKEPEAAHKTIAKLHTPVKQSFDRVNDHLKDINSGIKNYTKALDKKFKDRTLPSAENDALSSRASLINRALAMHLLREGHFDVATTFISEANAHPPTSMTSNTGLDPAEDVNGDVSMPDEQDMQQQQQQQQQQHASQQAWEAEFAPSAEKSASLQRQFSEMYHILDGLRQRQDLAPAIAWAKSHSAVLEARSSNLEYDLCRLQYISLFTNSGPLAALSYAREVFPHFPPRYASQTNSLLGALAFTSNISNSPYKTMFSPSNSDTTAAAAAAFTSEFCALLSLSSASPLLTAVTAGCIALPVLLKYSQIRTTHRTSWTTASELPVEVPLPLSFQFHSLFVCPVSKEQSTDENPPMMMPCGHVIAKESMDRVLIALRKAIHEMQRWYSFDAYHQKLVDFMRCKVL